MENGRVVGEKCLTFSPSLRWRRSKYLKYELKYISDITKKDVYSTYTPRFHGVFAPNSKWRALVTPAKRGKSKTLPEEEIPEKLPAERHVAITWAQRLKRVFNIDIETCNECGGAVKVIACIEDPTVIQKILTYLKKQDSGQNSHSNKSKISLLPDERAPPFVSLFP